MLALKRNALYNVLMDELTKFRKELDELKHELDCMELDYPELEPQELGDPESGKFINLKDVL